MTEPTREEVLWMLRERIAHLEIYRGRGPIGARLHELECMRMALRVIADMETPVPPVEAAGDAP